jgi:enoyl-CoA hydratase/carnithine racemase
MPIRPTGDADALLTERHDAVLLLTLNRPEKRNSLSPPLIQALNTAMDAAANDASTTVVVITGAGPSFCAGLDLRHLLELETEGRVAYMASAFALFRNLYEQPQPTIAAVNGAAMAGGFDIAAFCDLRLCAKEAKFAQTEILLGLTQIMYPVYKTIGLSRAKALALTGDSIPADEAHRIGLVHSVHPAEQLLEAALDLANRIASRPRTAVIETKRLGRELIEMDTSSAIAHMLDRITERLRSDEHQQALEEYARRFTRS